MKWNDTEIQFLVDNISLLSKGEICEHLKRSINSINRMTRRMNLKAKSYDLWSKGEEKILKEQYPYCKIDDIIPLLNSRSKNEIMLKANKMGLKKDIRDSTNMFRYELNHEYFKDINTPNKAYYLGWAFTDGNVCVQGSSLQYRLRLNSRDENILYKFRTDIGSTTPIYKRGDNSEINICSREFVNFLISMGCTPNKTFTIKCPFIPKVFQLDFIKGCFDGDGTHISNNKYIRSALVSASEPFLEDIRNILSEYTVISKITKEKNTNCYVLTLSQKKSNMKIFIDLMLSTKSDFLERKKSKMLEIASKV